MGICENKELRCTHQEKSQHQPYIEHINVIKNPYIKNSINYFEPGAELKIPGKRMSAKDMQTSQLNHRRLDLPPRRRKWHDGEIWSQPYNRQGGGLWISSADRILQRVHGSQPPPAWRTSGLLSGLYPSTYSTWVTLFAQSKKDLGSRRPRRPLALGQGGNTTGG